MALNGDKGSKSRSHIGGMNRCDSKAGDGSVKEMGGGFFRYFL